MPNTVFAVAAIYKIHLLLNAKYSFLKCQQQHAKKYKIQLKIIV